MLEHSTQASHIDKVEKQIRQVQIAKQPKIAEPHHSGKGTRARLNTAAEKHVFGSKYST